MSKSAVNSAAKSLAIDLKPRSIAVGLFHPGYVQTDMTSGRGDLTAVRICGVGGEGELKRRKSDLFRLGGERAAIVAPYR
jgi:NAD(P)-dependent dehydrogenase (short-subunit alcohol dehydrogenase family)